MKHCSSGQRATVPGKRWSQHHFQVFTHSFSHYLCMHPSIYQTADNRASLWFFSPLLGSSFPRNPLTYQKGGFLEILFLGAGLINQFSLRIYPLGLGEMGSWEMVLLFFTMYVSLKKKTLDKGYLTCQCSCGATSSCCAKRGLVNYQ